MKHCAKQVNSGFIYCAEKYKECDFFEKAIKKKTRSKHKQRVSKCGWGVFDTLVNKVDCYNMEIGRDFIKKNIEDNKFVPDETDSDPVWNETLHGLTVNGRLVE